MGISRETLCALCVFVASNHTQARPSFLNGYRNRNVRGRAFSILSLSWTDLAAHREDPALPAGVQDVRGLLAYLCARGGVWEQALADGKARELINKQFSLPETRISGAGAIAIVSASLG